MKKKVSILLIAIALISVSCNNENKKKIEKKVSAKEVVEKVASPKDYGVTNTQYRVAESNHFFQKSLKKVEINKFAHQRQIVNVEIQQVIRENQDILYSSAVVDVTKGLTLTVPEYDAYSIIQVIDMQNYSVATVYAGETKTITLDDLSVGNYVYLNARTQPTSNDEKGLKNAHKQQNALIIKAKSAKPYNAPDDLISDEKMLKIRKALIQDVANGKISDYSKMMGTKDFVNVQGHLYASAYGWGGLPIYDAGYLTVINKVDGKSCSSVTIDAPPVDYKKGGFWSITTYNEKGYLAFDKAAISNNDAVINEDGTITVRFNCEGEKNNLETVETFSVLLRLYAPLDVKEMSEYLKNGQEKYIVTK
ncbi:MAG: DUF1254 domain-containing protein [Bacteroidetes bacterium]|nr:DUF1254 domain-containing protein [Bacteroidota bacterium]